MEERLSEKEKHHTPWSHNHQTHEHTSPTQHNIKVVPLQWMELQMIAPNKYQKDNRKGMC